MIRARATAAGVLLLAASGLTGCVMPDQIAEMQKDIADVRQQMQSVRKDQDDAKAQLAAVQAKLDQGGDVKRTEFADLKSTVDNTKLQMTALDERSRDLEQRVDRLSSDVTRSRDAARRAQDAVPVPVPVVTPDGTAVDPSTGTTFPGTPSGTPPPAATGAPAPDALYNQAYADFSKGNYALAVSGFEEYATRFPDSPQADNALYWIGECHFSEGRFDKAVEAFDQMLEKYPDGDRAAAANLKKGLAYLEQNDVRSAIVQLRYVTTAFPASDEAKIAREKLSSLGAAAR